jgi:hypothetical protein
VHDVKLLMQTADLSSVEAVSLSRVNVTWSLSQYSWLSSYNATDNTVSWGLSFSL